MELINKNELSDIVFVAGPTRAGKIILCKIISSLERSENIRVDHLTEQLPVMERLGELSESACICLLRYSIHFMTYDNYLGRNSNFKSSDFTSIWNTPNPRLFFERLSMNKHSYGDSVEGDNAIENIKKSKLLFLMMIHYDLMHAGMFLKAFPNCIIYHLRRHPTDLVYSWLKKDYGSNFYSNPRSSVITFKYKGSIIPYYAHGWEEIYLTLNDTDKIIYMINHMNEVALNQKKELTEEQSKRIKHIIFDDLVTNSENYVLKISEDLNSSPTAYTDRILKEENCPRVINELDVKNKFEVIQKTASKKGLSILNQMNKNYELSINV